MSTKDLVTIQGVVGHSDEFTTEVTANKFSCQKSCAIQSKPICLQVRLQEQVTAWPISKAAHRGITTHTWRAL